MNIDITGIALAIVGIALIGLLVNNASGTAQVIGAAGNAFSGALGVATFQSNFINRN